MKSTLSLSLLLALPLAAATPDTRTGSFAPGERVTAPASHAPASESRTFVRSVVPLAGRIAVDLPSTGSGSLLVVAIPAGTIPAKASLSSALESPAGKRLPAAQAEGEDMRRFAVAAEELGLDLLSSNAEVLHTGRAEAGAYRLSASVPEGVAHVTVVAAEPDSTLTLRTWAEPLSRHAGEPVVLHAELFDGSAPVTGARVVARLAPVGGTAGPEVALYDDGRHGDGEAADGIYAARVEGLDLPSGFVNARFDSEGRDAHGAPFARTGSGGLMNEPALATLGAVRARFVDGRLRVVAAVEVATAGDYRLDAVVSGDAAADGSRPGFGWGEKTVTLEKGTSRVVLEIPTAELGGERPVHVDVRLLGLTTTSVAGRVEIDAAP